ncbi:F-box protein At4g00755 [Linum grandiflorum]
MRRFPAFRKLQSVIEPSRCVKDTAEVGCSGSGEDDGNLGVEHRALAFLAHSCSSFPVRECIGEAISASSTDNYPEESVRNTLEPLDRVARRPSYWSSKGQSSDAVPENLVYKLASGICVVTEINIKPFQGSNFALICSFSSLFLLEPFRVWLLLTSVFVYSLFSVGFSYILSKICTVPFGPFQFSNG